MEHRSLAEIVRIAWKIGNTLDLSGISYGRIHWGNKRDVLTEPHPYYLLLAGLVRWSGATRICEIGTHFGGSIRAMRRGVPPGATPKLVTIDIKRRPGLFDGETDITTIHGDARSRKALGAVTNAFAGTGGIDLLFVDGAHTFDAAWAEYCQYTTLLRPAYVVLDDITLNNEMSEVWRLVQSTVPPEDAFDVNTVHRDLRGPPGLGLVRLRRDRQTAVR